MKTRSFLLWIAALCAAFAVFLPAALRAAPGDLDTTFNPEVNNTVFCVAPQPDGNILLGGAFTTSTHVTGGTAVARHYIARVNSVGALDTTFDPEANAAVSCLTVQPDTNILVGGYFTSFQPNGAASATTCNYIARLTSAGTLDPIFNPNANLQVTSIALQANNQIIIAGAFTTLQPNGAASPIVRNYIARLNTDGTVDTTFDPNANGIVSCVAVQTDGKIVIGGYFTTLQPNGATSPTTCNHIARLNTDGTVDTTFSQSANGNVYCVALEADGTMVIGGVFTTLHLNASSTNPITRNSVARLESDGSLDLSFDPDANKGVNDVLVQTDGKVIIGGIFTTLQPNGAATASTVDYIARLDSDGNVDPTFYLNPSGIVEGMAIQANGEVLVAGAFGGVTPKGGVQTPIRCLARVFNDPVVEKVLVTGTTSKSTVQLLRSGALPETQRVTFEGSTNNGSTWANLTTATRISGGWQVTNFPAPPGSTARIRARAYAAGGLVNGSGNIQDVIAAYLTPDISVEQPFGTVLASNVATTDAGEVPLGASVGNTLTFTVRNAGQGALTLSGVTLSNNGAGDFKVSTAGMSTSVASGSATTFTVTFLPTGSTSSFRSATLLVASNANGTNSPYVIALTGLGLSTTASTGNDGLNDQAKYELSALGFNWQTSQPTLVQALFAGANSAGLYTTAQVQALNVDTPLIQKSTATGEFTLTVALQQSADLMTYTPLSLATGTATIDAAGELEFQFSSSTGAGFYRVQAH